MVRIIGRTFPVEEFYLEDVVEILNFEFDPCQKDKNNNLKDRGLCVDYKFRNSIAPFLKELEGKYSPETIE